MHEGPLTCGSSSGSECALGNNDLVDRAAVEANQSRPSSFTAVWARFVKWRDDHLIVPFCTSLGWLLNVTFLGKGIDSGDDEFTLRLELGENSFDEPTPFLSDAIGRMPANGLAEFAVA